MLGRRLAIRLLGLACVGIAFLGAPHRAVTHPLLNLLVGVMPVASIVAGIFVSSFTSLDRHRNRIARRLQAECDLPSIRVAFVRDSPVDEGIVTLSNGILAFTGTTTTFRIGRAHIDKIERAKSSGPEKRVKVTFRQDGELRSFAFDDKTPVAPFVPDPATLENALHQWMASAPADTTLDAPPNTSPPWSFLRSRTSLLLWFGAYTLAMRYLASLPLRSGEMTSFIVTLLLLAAVISVATFIQFLGLRARTLTEPLSILLDRPVSIRPVAVPPAPIPRPVDDVAHQTVAS